MSKKRPTAGGINVAAFLSSFYLCPIQVFALGYHRRCPLDKLIRQVAPKDE